MFNSRGVLNWSIVSAQFVIIAVGACLLMIAGEFDLSVGSMIGFAGMMIAIFTVKLGLEFFNAHGKEGIRKFNEIGVNNLMLDLKLKDIGQTVYKAIKAIDDISFGFLTIHGQGGKNMIEEAKKATNEIKCKPKIMMVTILTSLNNEDLKDMGNYNSVTQQVKNL